MTPKPDRRLPLALSRGSALLLLGMLWLLTLWSVLASDPDFPLPNPFAWLSLVAIPVYIACGFAARKSMRVVLRATLVLLPLTVVLVMEFVLEHRDVSTASQRIQVSDDVLLRYHYRPGTRGINERGLSDDPVVATLPPGALRVAVLGDSVPNDPSIDPEARFHRVMERRLHELGHPVDVLNVSCEGYNTIQEVRLFERVALDLDVDVVVVAYVLNDPYLQNGGYRRFGNSFFAFRFIPLVLTASEGNLCGMFDRMNQGYAFDLVVRASLERLKLLAEQHDFRVVVAALPVLEDFADPRCLAAYDRVGEVARAQGFGFLRLVDALSGMDHEDFYKPGGRYDVTHPNAEGHRIVGTWLADHLAEILAAQAS